VVGLLLACGLALVLQGPGLARWLGTATLLGGAWELRFLLPQARPRFRSAAPLLVLTAAFVWLFWEPLIGRPPATRDHGIHYFQTRLLWDELIPSGRLWGWTDALGAGYPYGESYPVLGYLLGGLPHALSFGLIGPRASYALGVAITWALGTLAVGWLAHTIARSLRPDSPTGPRWAFCIAGLLWLFDAGASRQGGWNYLLFHGVWPQMFSAVLWTLSLTLTLRALERPSPRRIAGAALMLAAGIMAHPFGMLAAAASAGLMLVAVLVSPKTMVAPLRTWAIVHGIAGLASAGVVLVFLGSAGGMARSPVQWSPLGQLSYETLIGSLFSTHWAWLGPLFLLGVLAIARRLEAAGLLAVLLCAALLVLGSHESMTVLRLDLLVSAFKNLQFPRYTIELKPAMFAIAGVGAVALAPALRALRAGEAPSRGRAWLLVAIAAPFVASFGPDVGRLKTRPVGALDTLEANRQGEIEATLLDALRREAQAHEGRLNVAYLRSGMSGAMFPLFSITDVNARLVLDGHIAAVNFKHRIRREEAGYDALGITHVIHDRPIEDKDEAFAARLTEVARSGRFRLARYTPETTMARVAVDRGAATIVTDEAEHIVLDVETDGYTQVLLRQAPHLRWTATFDGEPIDITPFKGVRGLTLLSIDVPRSGRVELTYQRKPLERVAGWLSIATWFFGLVALSQGRVLGFRQREVPGFVLPAVVGLGLAAVGVAAHLQDTKLERTWQHFAASRAYRGAPLPEDEATDDERPQLVRDVIDSGTFSFRRTPGRACNGLLGKDVLRGCSEAEHAPLRATNYRAPYLYRCIEFGLPPGGSVEIQLGDGRHDVLGRLTRRLLGSPGRGVLFGVASAPKKLSADNLDFFAPGSDQPTVATLRNNGRQMERFCLSAAEVAAPASKRP